MATQFQERETEDVRSFNAERRYAAHVVRRSFSLEALGGIATVALSILALLGILPAVLVPVAAIALGLAYLIEGSSLTSEYTRLFTREDEPTEVAQVGSGAGAGFVVGLSGLVLGILALAGAISGILLGAAAVVYGAGVLLSAMGTMKVRHIGMSVGPEGELRHDVEHEGVHLGGWFGALCGLGAMVLGIIVLLTVTVAGPVVPLTMVAFLAVGCATFISGTSVAWQMSRFYRPVPTH